MGQATDAHSDGPRPPARVSARRTGIVAAGVLALAVAGFTGHAIGSSVSPAESPAVVDAAPPLDLAFVESCAALVGPAATLEVAAVVDADAVAAAEELVAALPDELARHGATMLDTYRAVAAGDLSLFSDEAAIAEADAAAATIVDFLETTCRIDVSGD